MKKFISVSILAALLVGSVMFTFTGCGTSTKKSSHKSSTSETSSVTESISEESSEEEKVESEAASLAGLGTIRSSEGDDSSSSASSVASAAESNQPAGNQSTENMSVSDFKDLLSNQPVSVISTDYVVQDEEYKALYPDMLQGVIKNNTDKDIKNAVVAFTAWDSHDLPVKIKSKFDFSQGAYIRQVNYADINLVPGATYGNQSGFEIEDGQDIKKLEAVCVSYEAFDGSTWENPYYDEWTKLFEGVKYSDSLTVDVAVEDGASAASGGSANKAESKTESKPESKTESKGSVVDEATLNANINSQEVRVTSTNYVVQHEEYKALYPDMLQAIITNNSKLDIKNAVVAFVAWDKNKLPVKIKANIDFTDGSYVRQVNYSDINLAAGTSFGDDSGFEVDEECSIAECKAIVVSYEAFDGTKWENPYYSDWLGLYEGKSLK